MKELEKIKVPIAFHIDEFEQKFKSSMKSNVMLLDKITRYIIKTKGKQMRPMFVFFCADIFGEINESTYNGAALIELLHTATLIHDDVVDDSNIRRGFFSLNALWKNKISVLVGDYLLSTGLLLAIENNNFNLLKIVSSAVREMSEGELLQIEKARNLAIDEEIYFEIIRKKTAALIAACCACGTASITTDEKTIRNMYLLGETIGIAFQIKDDLFDYDMHNRTGKPHGLDIKEHKMTLPLIYLLNNSNITDRRKYINIVKNHSTDSEKVNMLIEKIITKGGIEYTKTKMQEYSKRAIEMVNELRDCPSKDSLCQLINYTIKREK